MLSLICIIILIRITIFHNNFMLGSDNIDMLIETLLYW